MVVAASVAADEVSDFVKVRVFLVVQDCAAAVQLRLGGRHGRACNNTKAKVKRLVTDSQQE